MKEITYNEKSNASPVEDREKQVCAEDLNEIKSVTNYNANQSTLINSTVVFDLLRIHNQYLISQGLAFTATVPEGTGSNLAYIAAEAGDYPGFELTGVVKGMVIRYSVDQWIKESLNVYYTKTEVDSLLEKEQNKLEAVAIDLIRQHDSSLNPQGFAVLGTQPSGSPSVAGESEEDDVNENYAYIATADGEYINFEGSDGEAISATKGQILNKSAGYWVAEDFNLKAQLIHDLVYKEDIDFNEESYELNMNNCNFDLDFN